MKTRRGQFQCIKKIEAQDGAADSNRHLSFKLDVEI